MYRASTLYIFSPYFDLRENGEIRTRVLMSTDSVEPVLRWIINQ